MERSTVSLNENDTSGLAVEVVGDRNGSSAQDIPHVHFIFFGIFLSTISTLGIILNGLVLYVLVKCKDHKRTANMYVINLATADLLVSALAFPFTVISCFWGRWTFGSIVCNWTACTVAATGLVSICTMAGIALDRYCIIARMSYNRVYSSYRRRVASIVVIWLYCVLWVLPPVFGLSRYVPEGVGISCSYDMSTDDSTYRSFILALFIGAFVLPLLIIIASYTALYCAIRRHEDEMKDQAKRLNVSSFRSNKKVDPEMAILRLSILVVVLFCVAWTPYAVISLYYVAGRPLTSPYATSLPSFFAKLSVIFNPLIYITCHPKIRRSTKKFMFLVCRSDSSSRSSDLNTRIKCSEAHSLSQCSSFRYTTSGVSPNSVRYSRSKTINTSFRAQTRSPNIRTSIRKPFVARATVEHSQGPSPEEVHMITDSIKMEKTPV